MLKEKQETNSTIGKKFFKSKENKGLKSIFFESIGNQNTLRDERLKNLLNLLEKNGFKIKNKK